MRSASPSSLAGGGRPPRNNVEAVETIGDRGVRVIRGSGWCPRPPEAEVLLIATGRAPNGDTLALQGGIERCRRVDRCR